MQCNGMSRVPICCVQKCIITINVCIVANRPGLAGTVPEFCLLSRWCPGWRVCPGFDKTCRNLTNTTCISCVLTLEGINDRNILATVAVLPGITIRERPWHNSIFGYAHIVRFIRKNYFRYGRRLGRGTLESLPVPFWAF